MDFLDETICRGEDSILLMKTGRYPSQLPQYPRLLFYRRSQDKHFNPLIFQTNAFYAEIVAELLKNSICMTLFVENTNLSLALDNVYSPHSLSIQNTHRISHLTKRKMNKNDIKEERRIKQINKK